MLHTSPLCTSCAHLREKWIESEDGLTERPTCGAFADGIPIEIYYENADHRKPWPGDNSIQFELKTGKQLPVTFR